MPLDALFGSFGGTRGSGYGGRASGTRFANIYGYDQQGNAVNNQQQWNQMQQQQNAPSPGYGPQPGGDFFSQLAGLFGAPQQQGPAKQPAQKPQYNLQQAITAPGNQYRPVIAPGGTGPYGGIAQGDRRAMFEGRARGFGSSQSPYRSVPFGGRR